MANEIGTATNLEDLVSKIITFLTTDVDLVTAGQQWAVNRQHRDGLAGFQTNLSVSSSARARKIDQSFRYDSRTLNNNSLVTADGYTRCTGYSPGVSFVRMELKAAEEITNVRLRACDTTSTALSTMISNFTLQYSDNDSNWTTALTVSSSPVYAQNEHKDFAVGGSPGAHIYWRIVIDSLNLGTAGSTVGWRSMLLQNLSGDIVNHYGSEVLFQAPGNAGADEIYTGLRSEYDSANGWYNLFLNAYTGYDPLELDFFEHPGSLPGYGDTDLMEVPMVPCWNTNMAYWFSASGRSFRFCVKVSTSFEGGYMGFILPYSTPSQYPYPISVGGSLIPNDTLRGPEWRYSYNNHAHSVFPTPAIDSTSVLQSGATFYIRTPEGQWRSCGQRSSSSNPDIIDRMVIGDTFPYTYSGPAMGMWPTVIHSSSVSFASLAYREALGGGYIMQPLIVIQRLPEPAPLGELEGVYNISGFNNASENITVWNGTTHAIFQNVTRTEVHEFWALALTN